MEGSFMHICFHRSECSYLHADVWKFSSKYILNKLSFKEPSIQQSEREQSEITKYIFTICLSRRPGEIGRL